MTYSDLVAIAALITAVGNVGYQLYQAWLKTKPEINKMEAEEESVLADATHTSLEASEISTKMLIGRIEELKKDLETEKSARKEDRAYFARRMRELDKELRDYRQWAAMLAKQVIETGKIPVSFIPSIDTEKMYALLKEKEEQDDANKQ